jgi:acyl dehydratase
MGELNRSFIGKTYDAKTFKVEADRTTAYAAATNDERPEYTDESRAGGITAPLLFAVVPATDLLIASLTDSEVGLPLDRTLHGEQDMTFVNPIRPGDVLVTDAKIVDIAETSTGETLSTEIVSRTEEDEERVRSLMTAYVRDPSKKRDKKIEEVPDRGEPLARATMSVRSDQPGVYAEASGDHNMPHTNEDFAKAIGFRTVILQGLCTMAFSSKAIVDELCGGDPTKLKRLKVRFSKVVYPDDVLTTSIWERDGVYVFDMRNQEGALVIKDGVAEIEA